MNSNPLLAENENKRLTLPLPMLVCVAMFTEKTEIKDVIVKLIMSGCLIAFLHNEIAPLPFGVFQIIFVQLFRYRTGKTLSVKIYHACNNGDRAYNYSRSLRYFGSVYGRARNFVNNALC